MSAPPLPILPTLHPPWPSTSTEIYELHEQYFEYMIMNDLEPASSAAKANCKQAAREREASSGKASFV
jgi:hypothetical protein